MAWKAGVAAPPGRGGQPARMAKDNRQGDVAMSSKNYQDAILNQVRKDNMPVTIYLTSGFQIRGVIKGFDNYVILIETDNKQQMVYKHAISTVVPLKYLNNLGAGASDED
jgi:host factor-I protein